MEQKFHHEPRIITSYVIAPSWSHDSLTTPVSSAGLHNQHHFVKGVLSLSLSLWAKLLGTMREMIKIHFTFGEYAHQCIESYEMLWKRPAANSTQALRNSLLVESYMNV
jgi:hypothetical protein